MAKGKVWTKQEDLKLMELVDAYISIDSRMNDRAILKMISESGDIPGRTFSALYNRYKIISVAPQKEVHSQPSGYDDFISGLDSFVQAFKGLVWENEQLKNQVSTLKDELHDYDSIKKVMEKARQMVVTEELGTFERPRFKMDRNGNLERTPN